MTRFFAAILAGFLSLASPALGDEPAGADDARDVIRQQLDAFRAKSAEDAFVFAAPSIKQMFRNSKNFGAMVKRGYPMIWNPAATEFLDAQTEGPHIKQYMRVIGQDGRSYIAEYLLVEIDGEWRIAGVKIEREEGAAAA